MQQEKEDMNQQKWIRRYRSWWIIKSNSEKEMATKIEFYGVFGVMYVFVLQFSFAIFFVFSLLVSKKSKQEIVVHSFSDDYHCICFIFVCIFGKYERIDIICVLVAIDCVYQFTFYDAVGNLQMDQYLMEMVLNLQFISM